MSGPILLTYCIWLLLTADFRWINLLVGLVVSVVVSRVFTYRFSAFQLIYLVLSFAIRIFQALWELVVIIFRPYRGEKVQQVQLAHTRNPWAVFCQTMIISLTPKTLVTKTDKTGRAEVHVLTTDEEDS
jgi:multisubunit Na+/H+ antiporter MnhE subunit